MRTLALAAILSLLAVCATMYVAVDRYRQDADFWKSSAYFWQDRSDSHKRTAYFYKARCR